ncbi:MAG: Mov34/MPN/PAD-1 family protein [Deltaproteobacteria bacterium]|nr:Mov34/MPN/PAD-1 family protein [Deltaproteobacteria bacterium]
MISIAITAGLRARIYAHARRCFPAECCGYLRGPEAVDEIVECRNAHADGDHPTTPDRGEDSAFVIAGAELIAFARSFDTPSPARVVYHSHTNGRAYFSAVDRDVATANGGPTYPVQHLVVGLTATTIIEAAQFAWDGAAHDWVEVARWPIAESR